MSSDRCEILYIFSYSCVNCLRSLKQIKRIYRRYKDGGLDVTLIHPPEWNFERSKKNVDHALKKLGISFPYKLDRHKKFIKKLNINFWPSCILLINNKIVFRAVGEGQYMEIERWIRKLLKSKKQSIFKRNQVYQDYKTFYLGKKKKGIIANLEGILKEGVIYKKGVWRQTKEFAYNFGINCCLMFKAKGNTIYFVVDSLSNRPSKILINIGDKFKKLITINKPGLYKISTIKFNKDVTIIPIGRIAFYAISYI